MKSNFLKTFKHWLGGLIAALCGTLSITAAHAQIYVANAGGSVGEYDATTGVATNANFITGLHAPYALAVSGNNLYVLGANGGPVSEYNATTGAGINTNLITGSSNIGGEGHAVSGNNLYVPGPFIVGKYGATTGAAINTNFISGLLNTPAGLVISGNILYVANPNPGNPYASIVGEYDATTGAAINASFITNGLNFPLGLALSGNNLYVANNNDFDPSAGTVGEYDATTGAVINTNFITGLNGVEGITVSGNVLFVTQYAIGIVGEYDATTGAAISTNFITVAGAPTFVLVVPKPAPIINIQKAVYLTSTNLLAGLNYQVQASSDLINWTNQGSVFTATTNVWQSTNYWNVNDWNQLFFRVQLAL